MEIAKGYPAEFVKTFELCLRVLDNSNIRFFDEHATLRKTSWGQWIVILCVTLHYASLTMFVIQVYNGSKETVDLASTVPIYMIASQALLKMLAVILNKKEIRYIIGELGTIWRTNLTEVQTNRKNVMLRKLELCQRIFFNTTIVGSWLYILTPLAEIVLRGFLHQDYELLLPFPCSYPFNASSNWVVYAGVYMFQAYSMFRFIFAILGTEFLIVTFCSHIATELSLLREDMRNMTPVCDKHSPNNSEENSEMTVEEFVRKHQKLTMLCKQVDKVFNKINFIIFLFATIIICFFGFAAKVAQGMVFMIVNYLSVTAMLVPLLILCYYGEMLRTESIGIAESTYNTVWYNGGIRYQRSLLLVILRSQEPCCLTSLNYSPITLRTFAKVLSTTWSYFSLITRVYEENY